MNIDWTFIALIEQWCRRTLIQACLQSDFFQDLERLDLSPYKYNHVNITGYRIVDSASSAVEDYTKKWSFGSNKGADHPLYVSDNWNIEVEAAIFSFLNCGLKNLCKMARLFFRQKMLCSMMGLECFPKQWMTLLQLKAYHLTHWSVTNSNRLLGDMGKKFWIISR